MISPTELLFVGLIGGIGSAATYAAVNSVKEIVPGEGGSTLKTEAERKSFHETIFGKGSLPPLERLGRGEVVNDLMPMPPDQGPPLPRTLGIKWPKMPWSK